MKKSPRPLPQDNLFDSYYYGTLVPADHELMQIDRRVDFGFIEAEMADCYAPREGAGRPPLAPEMMLRFCFLKVYADLSDAELTAQAQYNLLYRQFLHLGGNELPPDSSSLTVFRRRLGEERLKACLDRVVAGAQELGLVRHERAHVDSTGIVADIAIPRLRGLVLEALADGLAGLAQLGQGERAAPLQAEYEALAGDSLYWKTQARRDAHVLACWELLVRLAAVYDELMGRPGWTGAQEELLLAQAALLEKVLQRREGRKGSAKRDLLVSTQDPDARYSNREAGKKPYAGYKEHVIEDDASGIITDVIVTPANVDDSTQLQALVAGHQAHAGQATASVAADSKYFTGENLAYLDQECIEQFIAVPAAKGEKQGKFTGADFAHDAAGDCVMCPAGELATGGKWDEARQGWTFYFRKGQCAGCPLRERCTTQQRGRTLFISRHRERLLAARALRDDPAHQAAQRRRLRQERTFSLQKQRHGLRRTRYRGLPRVRLGVYLSVLVVNVRRIVQLLVAVEAAGGETRRLCAQAA
ncbi:MAG: IS1182 family transposase [Armatimonadetes bacterium]|jgi:IS5 family transposase|nr:IS1182 family transposase [Armatimonadota bacterium]